MDKVPAAPEGPGTKFLSRPGLKTESMDRNVQCELFPVSSPIIGSTFVHDGVSDGAAAVSQLQGSSTRAPRGPDCACLFTSLGSILCSVTEDSCCYNSVLVLKKKIFKRHSTISHLPHLWTRVGFLLGILPCWSLVICEV